MSLREERLEYIHLPAGSTLPAAESQPRRVLVLIEQNVTAEWRNQVSEWIVDSGCLYMMAWGIDCSLWDDSVDWALLEKFDFGTVPEDQFVMTSWHDDVSMDEVFFFCQKCASASAIELPLVTILHVTLQPSEDEIIEAYHKENSV